MAKSKQAAGDGSYQALEAELSEAERRCRLAGGHPARHHIR